MATKRAAPEPDRLITASLHGIVARHVQQAAHRPDAEQRAAAVAELAARTTRPDLLAEVAGLMLGFSGDRAAHGLLVDAGADMEAIPAWVVEGERRAAKQTHSAP